MLLEPFPHSSGRKGHLMLAEGGTKRHPSARPQNILSTALAIHPRRPGVCSAWRLHYAVPEAGHVRVVAYSVMGRLVAELVNEHKAVGEHFVEWHADGLPSGIYFVRLETSREVAMRRVTLLK